jgi:hypothetical protein
LNIYDGPSTDIKTIARISGNRSDVLGFDNVFISSGEYLTLEFVTDSYGTTSGFKLDYEIIGNLKDYKDKNQACTNDADCKGNGRCSEGSCVCKSEFSGYLCQNSNHWFIIEVSEFTPRERHALAYDSARNVIFVDAVGIH